MTTEAKHTLKARTAAGINWLGAFVLYAKGSTLTEVSDALQIPFQKLRLKYREENWDEMIRLNPIFGIPPASIIQQPNGAVVLRDAARRIEENREAALSVAQQLRGHILEHLKRHKDKTTLLKPDTIAKLARAAVQIDSSAMLALGDDPTPKFLPPPKLAPPLDNGEAPNSPGNRPIAMFNIVMPEVASGLRVEKDVSPDADTTEVEGELVGEPRDAVLDPRPAAVSGSERVELQADPGIDPTIPSRVPRLTAVDLDKIKAVPILSPDPPPPTRKFPSFMAAMGS